MPWYKDRDFPEVKTSNSDIVAVILNPKELERVIYEYNKLEDQRDALRSSNDSAIDHLNRESVKVYQLQEENKTLKEALEKIADPRKRDHSEPDAYTQLGCVMNIANEALSDPKWLK